MDKIKLNQDNEVFKQYITEESNVLKDISKINIFVGANNSGKSRFLREIFKLYTKSFVWLQKELYSLHFLMPFFGEKLFEMIKEEYPENGKDAFTQKDVEKIIIRNENKLWDDFKNEILENNRGSNLLYIKRGIEDVLRKSFDLQKKEMEGKYHTTYIPILRSLRQTKNSETAYKDRAFEDYFASFEKAYRTDDKKSTEIDIFTGESLFVDIQELQDTGYEGKKIREPYEKLISDYFFKGKEIFIFSNKKNKNSKTSTNDISIKIGDEKEFPIYELGDGIQTIILYTFPLFKYKDKTHFLFIEEPEQNLHPGMQRILLEILNKPIFKNVTVFFTTHSNHLLDTTIKTSKQTSIFSFKKESIDNEKGNEQIPTFKIENLKSSSTDILNNLGVKNSSVFLANCTIWVEGITDRKYIKQFLKIYFNKKEINYFQEDLHYSFVEYAGSNIAHWDFDEDIESDNIFAGSISNRIFLIADSDIKKIDEDNIEIDNERYFEIDGKKFEVNKWKRHKYLKDSLKDKFYRLDSKEIENLLTPKVIKDIVKNNENNDNKENVKFGEEFDKVSTFKNLKGEHVEKPIYWWQNIGKFIDNNVKEKKKTYTKDNSIKNKSTFCDKVVDYMESQKDNWNKDYDKLLSKEAQELCEKIYEFIKSNNKNL